MGHERRDGFHIGRGIADRAWFVTSDSRNRHVNDNEMKLATFNTNFTEMLISEAFQTWRIRIASLIDLGIASELGWPMLQISELASKEKLPIKFLEQIFTQLKSAGYVASRRETRRVLFSAPDEPNQIRCRYSAH